MKWKVSTHWVAPIAALIVACSPTDAVTNNDTNQTTEPKPEKPLDGWGSFKFGMTFDDALTVEPGVRWGSESFQDCRDEMPLKGCTLDPSEESYVSLTAGVALLPALYFNREGALYTVRMQKVMRGDISLAQCEHAHGALLDYLDYEWGSGTVPIRGKGPQVNRKTPKGRTFFRTGGPGPVFVMDIEDFSKRPDGRKITILSHYTAKSEYTPADCWLGIYYDGPESIERPPPEPIQDLSE